MSSPGVVLVNTFCSPGSKVYAAYIDYMNREEAIRRDCNSAFNLYAGYMDYMGNRIKSNVSELQALEDGVDDLDLLDHPEEISPLFTKNKDFLLPQEKKAFQDLFKKAEDNGSLLWQTVISFDNEYLSNLGYYNKNTGQFMEEDLRNMVRLSINRLLEKEDMINAEYTAAFHFNTDNLHVHFGIVEPIPTREKRLYPQYQLEKDENLKWTYKTRYNSKTGKKERIPILDQYGNQIYKEEYRGKFKQSSMEAAKSILVNHLEHTQDITKEINEVMRNNFLKSIDSTILFEDIEFRETFLAIYDKLPENRSYWNYGNHHLKDVKQDIDKLVQDYLIKYHYDEFSALKQQLEQIEAKYQRAYGGTVNHYKENKLNDLYSRMGNSILRSMKLYQEEIKEIKIVQEKEQIEKRAEEERIWEEKQKKKKLEKLIQSIEDSLSEKETNIESVYGFEIENQLMDRPLAPKENKEIRVKYKKTGFICPACKKALIERELNGSIAWCHLDGWKDNAPCKMIYNSIAEIEGYAEIPEREKEDLQEHSDESGDWIDSMRKYLNTVTITSKPKEYSLNYNDEYDNARELIYKDKAYMKAIKILEPLADNGNILAMEEIARIHERGLGVESDEKKAKYYYKDAFRGLEKLKDTHSEICHYRLGKHYYYGLGTEVDYQKAAEHFSKANTPYGDYALAKMYESGQGVDANIERAIELYENAEKGGNVYAAYKLGEYYDIGIHVEKDQEAAYFYFREALKGLSKIKLKDDNLNYRIGMMYLKGKGTEKNTDKGIEYLEEAAEQKHSYAKYQLGMLYTQEFDVPELQKKGIFYLEQVADENWYAANVLGKIYQEGILIEPDDAKSFLYYEKSLKGLLEEKEENRDKYKNYRIGQHYYYGLGTEVNYRKAGEYFAFAAEQENDSAAYTLAKMYESGQGVEVNMEKAEYYYQKAADSGNAYALYRLGEIYIKRENGETQATEYYKKALDLFEAEEEKNDALNYRIGIMYLEGKGIKRDVDKAIEYLEKSAEQNNSYAKYRLGIFYTEECSDPEVQKQGINYLEQVSEDNFSACFVLGRIYQEGILIEPDDGKSFLYYEKSLKGLLEEKEENRDKYKNYRIGQHYYYGLGTEVNYRKAGEYFALAAEQENDSAAYTLAKMYESGQGVEVNMEKAEYYYQRAADSGNAYALYRLGEIYIKRENGETQATEYYKKALDLFEAEEEKNDALNYRIGIMYLEGKGTLIDVLKGLDFLEKSAKQGNLNSLYKLGKIYTMDTKNKVLYKKGIDYLFEAANRNHSYAQYSCGMLYMHTGDYANAKEMLSKSSAQGNINAINALVNIESKSYNAAKGQIPFNNSQALRQSLYWLRHSLQDDKEKYLNLEDFYELEQKQKDIEKDI